jgi:uncharacterized repeat protein (TIGR03803 family)
LIQRSDGNFYGTTLYGGTTNNGTAFKMDSLGGVTTLHSFAGNDGAFPYAGLTEGRDGYFYGTTFLGGVANNGTVFRMDSSGAVTTIHVLAGNDGANPYAALIQGSDGNLYGTTGFGGRYIGTVFRISPPALQLELSAVASRKAHGGLGPFDINLPLTGNPGIECRSGGTNDRYTMVFTFANTLASVGGVSVTSGTGTVTTSTVNSSDARQYIVNLRGVLNAHTITVSLTNLRDSYGNVNPTVAASMGVLIGDTNADGVVNSADIAQTKSQSGIAVSGANFREDINADASLNSSDISLVKSESGTGLP